MIYSTKLHHIYLFCSLLIIINVSLFHFSKPRSFISISPVDLTIITNESFQCVKTKLLLDKYQTTVCVHHVKQDTDVSGLLLNSGIWEENLVTRFVRILSTYPHLAFFDIGANLGVYTMYAASAGCSNVIAIECFRPNIERIRRSIQLEHFEKQIIILPYALYNQSNVYLSLKSNIINNIGSQRLNQQIIKNKHQINDSSIVETMRFDDLLSIVKQRNIHEAILKIDIETSEHFLCETGEKMFKQINISFIMMEWALIKTIPDRAKLIIQFFIDRSYIPVDSNTCQSLTNQTDYKQWNSQDIYWIKPNYTHFCNF